MASAKGCCAGCRDSCPAASSSEWRSPALAATTALSVDLRRRRFALLRAVGATRGQVRLAVLAEQALLAVTGGLLGYLPGRLLGALGVHALVAHGILPAGTSVALNPWFALLACAITLPVCVLSGLVSARRAARTSPARAMRDARAERTWPHPVRVLLGLAAAAGFVVLSVLSLHQSGPGTEVAMAGPLLMTGMAAVALLGPLLVAGPGQHPQAAPPHLRGHPHRDGRGPDRRDRLLQHEHRPRHRPPVHAGGHRRPRRRPHPQHGHGCAGRKARTF